MNKKFTSDIDIDFADRDKLLELLDVIPASIVRDGELVKHNTGVYATNVPTDPFTGQCSLDHKEAEARGYAKLDLLNVGVYEQVKSEQHLVELMAEPDWSLLNDTAFFEQLIHVGNHYNTMKKMPEPINSIPRLMMFMAIIRPAKRHLIGKDWKTVAETIWNKPTDGTYAFKSSHSCAYAHLVVVHINLLCQK
jgi:hypothetical protein